MKYLYSIFFCLLVVTLVTNSFGQSSRLSNDIDSSSLLNDSSVLYFSARHLPHFIHVRWELESSEKVVGRIIDNNKQVVIQWVDISTGIYMKQIAIDNLAAGMYFLQLQSGTEKVSRQFFIAK